MIQLVFCALLALSNLCAECLQLRLVEGVGQVVEHILGPSTLCLARLVGILAKQVGKDLHLAPDVAVDEPLHHIAHRARPALTIERPQDASGLPRRHQRTLRAIPQHVIVRQVGQRGHILRQRVRQLVQRIDDEAPLADVEAHQVFVKFLIEFFRILSLSGNTSVAAGAGLVGEDHTPEGAVEEVFL